MTVKSSSVVICVCRLTLKPLFFKLVGRKFDVAELCDGNGINAIAEAVKEFEECMGIRLADVPTPGSDDASRPRPSGSSVPRRASKRRSDSESSDESSKRRRASTDDSDNDFEGFSPRAADSDSEMPHAADSEIEMPRAADSEVESSEVESNGTADYSQTVREPQTDDELSTSIFSRPSAITGAEIDFLINYNICTSRFD